MNRLTQIVVALAVLVVFVAAGWHELRGNSSAASTVPLPLPAGAVQPAASLLKDADNLDCLEKDMVQRTTGCLEKMLKSENQMEVYQMEIDLGDGINRRLGQQIAVPEAGAPNGYTWDAKLRALWPKPVPADPSAAPPAAAKIPAK